MTRIERMRGQRQLKAKCRSLDAALRAPLRMTADVIPSERSESRDLHLRHGRAAQQIDAERAEENGEGSEMQ
ncbi:MAG TPA: hypothetical protein VFS59_09150 [Gemmatimonadaceae bacterium]|nr:hypothetical protein [Gemmatimonadaceae bacterium]